MIDKSLISSLSDAQQYQLSRIHELNMESSRDVDIIKREANRQVYDSLATVNSAKATLDESVRNTLNKDIAVQQYELESIRKAMENQIYTDIQNQWLAMQEADLPLELSEAEKQYYDAYSPAQAYFLTNRDKFENNADRLINAALIGEIEERNTETAIENEIVESVEIGPNIDDDIPLVPPIIDDDQKICYAYLEDANGKIQSLPIAINKNQDCSQLGFHSTPYVPPSPPPQGPLPPTNEPYVLNPTITLGDGQYVYWTTGIEECKGEGFILAPSTWSDGSNKFSCYKLNTVFTGTNPNSPGNPIYTPPGQETICNPVWNPWDTSSDGKDSKTEEVVTCPPGCVNINAMQDKSMKLSMNCVEWDDIDVCGKNVTLKSNHIENVSKVIDSKGIPDGWSLIGIANTILSFTPGVGVWNYITGSTGISGESSGSSLFSASGIATELMQFGVTSMAASVRQYLGDCVGDIEQVIKSLTVQAASGWAGTLTMSDVPYHFMSFTYAGKHANPQLIPSQADIDAMYLNDNLSNDAWSCYTRALGNLPNLHRVARDTKRTRIGVRELIMLHRYGKITDDEYKEEVRKLGVLYDDDKKNFEDSQVSLPGLPDILRFMVRDADNESIVERYQLDQGFKDSYKDKLKLWAKTQGIEEETALYFWRAHWEYPSPTALYEMLKRLRPGTVPGHLQVTKDDALELLKIADIAPYWREKLLAVSYNVPTRTDVKKGFNIDAIPENKLVDMLQDNGYTEDDAKVIKDIYVSEKEIYKQNLYSRWSAFTPKSIAKNVSEGSMTEEEARLQLGRMNFKPEQIDKILESAMLKSQQLAREQCIAGYRRQYMLGINTEDVTKNKIVQLGVDNNVADKLVLNWSCKRVSNVKEVPAMKNATYYVNGIIDSAELARRLRNLNYTEDSITLMLIDAQYRKEKKEIDEARRAESQRRSDIRWQQQQEDRAEQELQQMIPAGTGKSSQP